MSNAPFPIQPELTAIAIGYRNTRLIADAILPRIPVGTQEFKYLMYNLADGFTVPDTKVGRKGKVNEVECAVQECPGCLMGASDVEHEDGVRAGRDSVHGRGLYGARRGRPLYERSSLLRAADH